MKHTRLGEKIMFIPYERIMLIAVIILCCLSSGAQSTKTTQSSDRNATLLVDTDDACHLFIDDQDKGTITPEPSSKFSVTVGEHILKCKNDSIPDLVWRKAIEVKDTSQVVAVVSLKSLHIQYDQAVGKAQNQKTEAEANATKQLAEAQAEEKEREAAKAAMPARVLDMLRGPWYAYEAHKEGHLFIENTLQFRESFDSVTLTREYRDVPLFTVRKSTYVYKIAVNLKPENSEALTGKITCQTLVGSKIKNSDSHSFVQCEPDKSFPVTIAIQDRNDLRLEWDNRSIVFRRTRE